MLDPIFEWFHQQTPKDQQILKIGGVAVIIGIIYFAIINPLYQGKNKALKDVVIAEKNLQFLKQSAASLTTKISVNSRNSRLSASQIASSTARKHSVNLARIAPKRNNQTSLTIDNTQFNHLMSWIGDIQKQGLAIETIDINKVEQVGFVKATITVSGGAG